MLLARGFCGPPVLISPYVYHGIRHIRKTTDQIIHAYIEYAILIVIIIIIISYYYNITRDAADCASPIFALRRKKHKYVL